MKLNSPKGGKNPRTLRKYIPFLTWQKKDDLRKVLEEFNE